MPSAAACACAASLETPALAPVPVRRTPLRLLALTACVPHPPSPAPPATRGCVGSSSRSDPSGSAIQDRIRVFSADPSEPGRGSQPGAGGAFATPGGAKAPPAGRAAPGSNGAQRRPVSDDAGGGGGGPRDAVRSVLDAQVAVREYDAGAGAGGSGDMLHASLLDTSGLDRSGQPALAEHGRRMSLPFSDIYDSAGGVSDEGTRRDAIRALASAPALETNADVLVYGDPDIFTEHDRLVNNVHSIFDSIDDEIQVDVLQIAPDKLPMFSAEFNSRTTLGISFKNMMVEDTVIGGPACLSGEIEVGDLLVEVDGTPATLDNKFDLLLGNDEPGTRVLLKLQVKSSGLLAPDGKRYKEVPLTRMSTGHIADRRRMAELFSAVMEKADQVGDESFSYNLKQCQNLHRRMLEVEHLHFSYLRENCTIRQGE